MDMLKTLLMGMLTEEQKIEMVRVMDSLSTVGRATTEQQVPAVGLCRITIEKIGG